MSKHLRMVVPSVLAILALGAPAHSFILADHHEAVIQARRDRLVSIQETSEAINARAQAENRDMTTEERTEFDGLYAEFQSVTGDIQRLERQIAMNAGISAPRGRVTDPEPVDPSDPNPTPAPRASNAAPQQPGGPRQPTVPATPVTARGTAGFRFFGEFANSVRMASARGADLDARLRNAAVTTYGNEGVGADGGFAVPPDYRSEILAKIFNEDSLIQRTDRLQTSSNSITLPTDETTPWQNTGGIQAFWTAEAGTKQQSKPVLGETTVKLHTLACLVPMTEELLEDSPAMGSYIQRKAPEKMDFKVSDAIIRGTGVGQPLGILNSPALVTVAAEGGQSADTVVVNNILKMWGRLPVRSRRTAVWLMHPDVEATLPSLMIGNVPVYMPPNGLSASPYGTLMGRPVIPHQVTETIGDLGDVMLVDLSQYLSATKLGNGRDAMGIKQDVSIHLWFDQDMVAFRFTMRVAGQPWWAAAVAQRDGPNVQSPFVVLASR